MIDERKTCDGERQHQFVSKLPPLDHARKLMVCHKSALTLSVMTSFIR